MYADIAAFFAFVAWTPEAQQNFEDPGWDSPFPTSEPGVYILRQLKKWAHNHSAVLRRAAQAGSSTSTVGTGLRPEGGASPIVRPGRQEEGASRSGGYRSRRGSGYQRSCARA